MFGHGVSTFDELSYAHDRIVKIIRRFRIGYISHSEAFIIHVGE